MFTFGTVRDVLNHTHTTVRKMEVRGFIDVI